MNADIQTEPQGEFQLSASPNW